MSSSRVAIFDFTCCEGCQLQLFDLEEDLLRLLTVVDVVEWREAMSVHRETYDIAIIEGSITRPADEARLQQIRAQAKILIALGACATIGGVNSLVNTFGSLEEVGRIVYGEAARQPHLQTGPVKAVSAVVPVEYNIHGCPINLAEFNRVLRSFLHGDAPVIADYPVCVECKMRENTCRYEYDEVCLGVITRAGCGAPCPAAGMWCFGCRGLIDEPNVNAAKEIMRDYHKTLDELKNRMRLFNSDQERRYG